MMIRRREEKKKEGKEDVFLVHFLFHTRPSSVFNNMTHIPIN